MARGRRTTGPERVRQTRNTARRGGANMPFQGGLALNQGFQQGPGQLPLREPRGVQQQNEVRCPVGQKPGMGPGGRMTCIPDTDRSAQRPGAGIPMPNRNRSNKEGY